MGFNDDIKVLHSANSTVVADVDAAVAAAKGLRMCGFSCGETSGNDAIAFKIINGATGATDDMIVYEKQPQDVSNTVWMWPGVDCASGISVDWIEGTFDLTIYYYIGQDRP